MCSNQQMTGQELRGAMRTVGARLAPVPSFAGSAPILLPGATAEASCLRSFIQQLRVARQSLDAAHPFQPTPSKSVVLVDGQHHRRSAAHGLGEIAQGLGNV